MCGIFGWINEEPDTAAEIAAQALEILKHRGPNDQGFHSGMNWALGFRRLSILDLSPLGHQPMASPDGRFWLVFNGEIYNHLELRQELEREGEQFRSTSDTEVLLRLLARRGEAALTQLNGMFALALIDTQRRTFLIARDRLGVKPLYYYAVGNRLRFASELKALLAWPAAPRDLDPAAVIEYLSLGYLPNEMCIFQSYRKLPPGHFIAGSLDAPSQAQPHPYWQLELNPSRTGAPLSGDQLDELHDLLSDSVRIRLRSDVPVGIFLSGGLDSGIIAALSAQVAPEARPLALTVGFTEAQYDERSLAQATAAHAGLEHRTIILQPSSISEIDRLAWYYDEPFGDLSALPTFALCEAAAAHATVFLSGDGGDEAFGGYRRYIEAQRYQMLANLPGWTTATAHRLAQLLPELAAPRFRLLKSSLPDAGFAAVFDSLPLDPALRVVLHSDLRGELWHAGSSVWDRWSRSRGVCLTARQQMLDYTLYLPDDILVKMDRASMAHSIEVRSPFLDYRLVEWAGRLPRATLLNSMQGKLPLRALGERLLPANVQRGGKRGFAVPLLDWFRQPEGKAFVDERLIGVTAKQRGLWDPNGVRQLLNAHQATSGRSFEPLLWRLLMLDAWARHYVDKPGVLANSAYALAQYG